MTDALDTLYRDAARLIRSGRALDAVTRLRAHLVDAADDEIARSLLGSALLKSGRLDEALAELEAATRLKPESSRAFGDLGYAMLDAGRDSEALAALGRAVELDPGFHPGWSGLSRLHYRRGDFADARTAFARAAACDPLAADFPAVLEAMSAERYAEAERRCRAFLERLPGHPRSAYTLAHLASKVGAHEQAASILGRALDYYPADANLRAARVVAFEEAGRYAEALAEAKLLNALDADAVSSWLVLGRVHGHCGNYADCLACYDRALALVDDGAAEANIELLRGHVLKIVGRREDSIAAYRRSLELEPGSGAGWWGLADMKTHAFSDDDVAAMRKLVADESLKPEQRAQAAFALGKACEDREDTTGAFASYADGNALRPDSGFDPQAFERGIATIIRHFDKATLVRQAEPAPAGPRPIFIVGLPRAGSTLIEQILASHPEVEGTMELATLPNLVRRITIDGGRQGRGYPESIGHFSPGELAAYGRAYLDDTAMYRTDRPTFIDKLPTNFDKVGLIHMILPEAIVIDARRHPLDCGLSCFRQHFAGGHPWSRDLAHIGSYYNGYLALMDHWDAVLPGKVLCLRYERVVADTETAVRELLAHCGLSWNDACLRFFENRRPVRTASSEQVRQPIYRQAVARWEAYRDQLAPLAAALGPETLARFRPD